MFWWGEDHRQSFRQKKASGEGNFLNLSFRVADLSVGHRGLVFTKDTGEAFIIRTKLAEDGSRISSRQKFVKCDERIEAVSCTDDEDDVILLSVSGKIYCVKSGVIPFTPRSPEALSNVTIHRVCCGSCHTVALSEDGQVYTWGLDSRGQLGLGGNRSGSVSPQQVHSLCSIPVVQVSAGGHQSFVLSASGRVFAWGANKCGQLGLGDTEDRNSPTAVETLNRWNVVQLACGQEHTAALTEDGSVFSFGSGRFGQLGHNSFQNELQPRLVAELWGAKVTKIACGRNHTLVLTASPKLYSFGANDHQQLGRGCEDSHPSVPLPVQIPQNGHVVADIFAAGDCSFAACWSEATGPNRVQQNHKMLQPIEQMMDCWMSNDALSDSKKLKKIKMEVRRSFSCASVMNRSFLDQRKAKHLQTTPNCPGLDLTLAQNVFGKLLSWTVLLTEVLAAVEKLLPSLDERPPGVEGLRVFLFLNELLCALWERAPEQGPKLAEQLSAAVHKLPEQKRQTLARWWSSLSPTQMVRQVKAWTWTLSYILPLQSLPRSAASNMLQILQDMFNANNKKIPEKTFCLELNEEFLKRAHKRVMSQNMDLKDSHLMVISFPFVLDLKSKKTIFDCSTRWSQEHYKAPGFGRYPVLSLYGLHLRRASLLEDAFVQLAAAQPAELKKWLVVYFDGDPKITDVYKRDFFHHFFMEVMKKKPGMFTLNKSETLTWFSSRTTAQDEEDFFLFGIVCGLALYNCSIVRLPFPLVLFKKLLEVEPTLEDMMEFSPEVGRSLQHILNYEDEDLEDQDMFFLINWDQTDVDLDPSSPGKPVTSQNRGEFVHAYINYVFNTSVERAFQEFKRGFFQVCEQHMVKLFRPEELQGLLVGLDAYDWTKFKKNTEYQLGGDLRHPNVQMFWEVFHELTEEQKRDFLWFLTGFRKVPVLGMDQIRMRLRLRTVNSGSPDLHFPEALTCHSILDLPLYSTREILRERLKEALQPQRDFTKSAGAG